MNANVTYFDALPSTNDKAMELLLAGCAEGTVVAARAQTHGRGQQGARWESEEGKNLTFSLALRPSFLPAGHMFYLSKAVALGVVDFLRRQRISAEVKWPNDVYVGDRKICGLLMEQRICGERIAQSVAGVGLNVNQQRFVHAPGATSTLLCDGKTRRLDAALRQVVACILHRYAFLRSSPPAAWRQLDEEYLAHLYRRRGFFAYRCAGGQLTAKILGVAPGGELVLQAESGEVCRFGFKEVEFLT